MKHSEEIKIRLLNCLGWYSLLKVENVGRKMLNLKKLYNFWSTGILNPSFGLNLQKNQFIISKYVSY